MLEHADINKNKGTQVTPSDLIHISLLLWKNVIKLNNLNCLYCVGAKA
jgi:hypothetical protein